MNRDKMASLKNPYQLLVVDIDGTLIDGDGKISADNRQALAAARRRGMRVCLSSGRARMACLPFITQLSLDSYHIFFDGALISTPNLEQEVYSRPISDAVVRQMVESSHSLGLALELYSASSYFAERETWSVEAHRQFFNLEPTILDFAGILGRERIIKGLVAITDPAEEAKVERFCRHLDGRLHFSRARTPAYPNVTFINIVVPETSKGKALEALASHLGVPLDEVIAVGDGTNDISLLSSAGLAIAMGNASSEVKAVADHVTLDVDHSGLAAAIRQFLL